MVGWGNPGLRTMEETQHRVDYARGNALRGGHDIVRSGFGRMAGLVVIASVAITGLGQIALGEFPIQGPPPGRELGIGRCECQSALKINPGSALNFDPARDDGSGAMVMRFDDSGPVLGAPALVAGLGSRQPQLRSALGAHTR
jgi:hypothetical protein